MKIILIIAIALDVVQLIIEIYNLIHFLIHSFTSYDTPANTSPTEVLNDICSRYCSHSKSKVSLKKNI